MKTIVKSLILAIAIFLMHLVLGVSAHIIFKLGDTGYYGLVGGLIFYFLVAFWAYLLLSYVYLYATRNDRSRKVKYFKATVVITTGYLFSRIPDMIDNDFISDFKQVPFIIIFLLIPALVEIENLIQQKLVRKH
jgi:uncharacterized membrane-anchored protein